MTEPLNIFLCNGKVVKASLTNSAFVQPECQSHQSAAGLDESLKENTKTFTSLTPVEGHGRLFL